jgi:predicted molibdopterin-dependent oxidoreductase YjgC
MGKRYERLTTPLVRDGDSLREATWEEAVTRTAEGLTRNPGTTTGLFSCSKATNELNFIAQKFARTVIGNNNVDSCNRT